MQRRRLRLKPSETADYDDVLHWAKEVSHAGRTLYEASSNGKCDRKGSQVGGPYGDIVRRMRQTNEYAAPDACSEPSQVDSGYGGSDHRSERRTRTGSRPQKIGTKAWCRKRRSQKQSDTVKRLCERREQQDEGIRCEKNWERRPSRNTPKALTLRLPVQPFDIRNYYPLDAAYNEAWVAFQSAMESGSDFDRASELLHRAARSWKDSPER